MPNIQFDIDLTNINFTPNETKIYLALLSLGKGQVSQITRKAGINRTTGYEVLNTLITKGLISISGKKPKQEYTAESPDKLQEYINNEAERIGQYKQIVAKLVPQLKSIHNINDRPQVRFYEGKDGIQEVYEDTLTSHETILAYASVEDTQHTLPNYFPKYYKLRAQKKIKIKAIFPDTPEARELTTHNQEELRETALIPVDQYPFSPEINIYDNKVMIASWKEQLGIIIESTEISDAMKTIYKLAWAEANRIDSKKK